MKTAVLLCILFMFGSGLLALTDYGTNPDNWPSGWNTSSTNHTNVSCNWTATG